MANSTIELHMKHGYVAIVDAIDGDLAVYKWGSKAADHLHPRRSSTVQSQIKGQQKQKQKTVWLHRTILERKLGRPLLPEEFCDHKNGKPLDNRRNNLRLANRLQNRWNTKKSSRNQSGYKGVHFHSQAKKWTSQITIDGKTISLGLFDTPQAAHEVYSAKAKELFGEFAREE